MSKRILSIFLTVAMLVSLGIFQPGTVLALESNSEAKISADLKTRMIAAKNDELIPVYVWIDDIDHQQVDALTEKSTSLSKQILIASEQTVLSTASNSSNTTISDFKNTDELSSFLEVTEEARDELSQKVDTYITTNRTISRTAYSQNNKSFIASNLKDADIVFESQYAPMLICNLTKSDITNLSRNDKVTSISLYVDYEVQDFGNLNVSLPAISADITKSEGIRGKYVKIGQIETKRPNTNVSALSGKNITRRGTGASDHASLVAAIMIGADGIAPGASLYSTSAYYNASTGTDNSFYSAAIEYENIEWLVTQGVTIINRSFGGTTYGNYDSFSQWIDHLVNQHNVTFVQASGNSGPLGYVALQSYNAIVVGGINDNGTSTTADDTYYEYTSYKSGLNNKPDVVAPAVGFSIPESYDGEAISGTSFAAPHVTGVIAQMMCVATSLKLRPDAVKAAVMASCDRKTIPGASLDTLTNEEGAGVINALNAVNSLSRVASQGTYYDTTEESISFNFYPLSTGTKTVVISWLINVTGSGANHSTISEPNLTDFDLYVYDSNGNEVARSWSGSENVEYIRFNATTTAKYTIVIRRYTNNTSLERIALAYHR